MKQFMRRATRFSLRLILLAGLLAGLLFAGGAQTARAASFTVTTTADSGAGSLRQAVLDANASAGADTITFSLGGTITLGSALPALTDDVTIDASGQAVTIDGANAYQVLSVSTGTTVALKGLTIAHGSTNSSGGAIQNAGTLSVTNSTFSANSASYAGAIYNNGGALTVTDSTFSGNSSVTGGAIWNSGGTLTVTGATFSGNSAFSPLGDGGAISNTNGAATILNTTFANNSASSSGGASGGGISNRNGSLSVTNSSFSGNSVDFGSGGAIFNSGTLNVSGSTFANNQVIDVGGGGALYSSTSGTIANSTFTGNSASGSVVASSATGGAIYFSGSMIISSSTISGNSANASGGGVYDANTDSGSQGKIGNSIVALNTAAADADISSAGEMPLTHNDVLGVSPAVISSPTNIVGIDPLLGALQYNGGPTQTMALNPGSPAINSAASIDSYLGHSLPTDQRGLARPQSGGYDAGAFEAGVLTPVLSINNVSQLEGNSGTSVFTFTVSLSTPPGQGGVTFDIATQDNTATTANSDYVQKALSAQTIPAGSSSYTFDVSVIGDTVAEPDETFFVNLSNVSGATPASAQGTGTILNDDLLCPAGSYDSGSGCVAAAAGYYVPAPGAASQIPCAVGSYQPLTGSTSCTPADAGHYVDVSAAAAQSACLPGFYQPNTGQANCIAAESGSFVSASAAVSSTPCLAGSYQPNTGSTSCLLADPGYYVPAPAATAEIACAPGFSSTAGATGCTPLVVGQTITFAALSNHTYGDPDFTISASASSGLAISFTVGGSDQCALSGSTLHITGAGACTVTAHQDGSASYTAAADVARSFTIAQAALTISADNKTRVYGAANPLLSASYSGFVNGEGPANLATPVSLTASAVPASPAGSYPISASGASAANYSITFVNGTLTVTTAATSLVYNGGQLVNLGSTFQPAGLLSSAAPACASGQLVKFSLDVNPTNGAAGTYVLGSATTNASGQATLSPVSTSGWLQGTYNLNAEFSGTVNCDPSLNSAPLAVTQTGNSAYGWGSYSLAGSGRVEFGFAVGKTSSTCSLNCAYKGQLLLENEGKWMLKGALNSYSKLGTGKAASTGVGTLYWWKASLNNGRGGWALAAQSVNYTINFFDSNQPLKTSTDSFGISIQYTPVAPQPALLPNSGLTTLKSGDIVAK